MSTTWNVCLEGDTYSFLVTDCGTERLARCKAREWLGVDKLPRGTNVWQYPKIPECYPNEY
jgi:hypothetical protein